MNFKARLSSHLNRMVLAYLVLAISIVLTVGAFWKLREHFAEKQHQRFLVSSKAIFDSTEVHVAIWLRLLEGVRGLFHHELPTPKSLNAYFESIGLKKLASETGLHDVGVIWRIPPEHSQGHIDYLKSHGYIGYHPTWPQGDPHDHYPIVHLETADGPQVPGWDALLDPIRSKAMFRSRDLAGPSITPPVEIYRPDASPGPRGFVLYLPIFRKGVVPTSAEERQTNVLGYIFAALNAERMFSQVTSDTDGLVDFEIHNGAPGTATLLYDTDKTVDLSSTTDPAPLRGYLQADVFGETWRFLFQARPELISPIERRLPPGVLLTGLTMSFLFFGLVHLQARGRRTAEQLSRELQRSDTAIRATNEILENTLITSREAEQRLAKLLSLQTATIESTADGILVVDQDMRIVSYNQQFARMWKLSPEILAARDDGRAIRYVLDQLIEPELFQEKIEYLYKNPEGESYDVLAFKDGRFFERYSRPHKVETEIVGRVWSFRDITERRRSHEAVERSERQYRNLVQTSHDLIWSVDAEGRWTFTNNAAQRIYGWTPEELIGRPFTELLLPEHAGRDLKVFAEIKEGKPAFRYVTEHLRKDRRSVWLSFNALALHDESGKFIGATGTARDITEQLKSEQLLRDSEALYHSLVENIPFAIFRKDLQGRYTFGNSVFCSLIGVARQDIPGKTASDFFPAETALKYQEDDRKLLESGESLDAISLVHDSSGQPRFMQTIKSVLRDSNGRLFGVQGLFWDVTARHLAEQRLAEEKERLAVTLRSIGEGVVATDTSGLICLMNPVAESISGLRADQAIGRSLNEVFPLLDQNSRLPVNDLATLVLEGDEGTRRHRYLLRLPDGAERIINEHGSMLRDRQGKCQGAVFIFQDVTDSVRLEGELQKNSKLESIGLLAGGIAHDFNNILTSVVGHLSLLRVVHELSPNVAEGLAEVEKAALRARDLTQQLLTFARGGAPLKATASLVEILREATQFALHGSNVSPVFELPPELSAAEVDAGQISQVINNLVLNAVQATPHGGKLFVSARNYCHPEGGNLPLPPGHYLHLSVRDQGHGIAPHHLSKVFDPYFSTKKGGNGLGLATAYSIIKRHDGLITVDSDLGVGTVFHIYLPASNALPRKISTPQGPIAPGKGRVLAMDDEPAIRHLLNSILRQFGYETKTVADGAELIAQYSAALKGHKPYHAVIMDLTVPGGMGGKEAIRELLKINPAVQAIVSSGYSTDPIMSNFKEAGFCAVVEKPYRVETLARAVQLAVEQAIAP